MRSSKNIERIAAGLFFSISVAQGATNGNPVSACVDIYTNTLNRLSEDDRKSIAIMDMAKRHCSSSGTDVGLSFESESQAVVNAIPVVSNLLGSANIKTREQFCKAYQEGKFFEQTSHYSLKEPVVDAMKQANSCIDIANKGVLITHDELSPGKIVFTGTPRQADLVIRLSVAAFPDNEWSCTSPKPGGWFSNVEKVDRSEVRRDNQPFVVECKRDGRVDASGDVIYSPGALSLNIGSLGSYTVTLRPPNTIFGVRSAKEANSLIEALSADKKNLESRVANLDAEVKTLKEKKYSGTRFLFTDVKIGTAFDSSKVSCSTYNLGEDVWKNVVSSKFCRKGGRITSYAKAELSEMMHGDSRDLPKKCGGNDWIWIDAVCEYPGDPIKN